MRLNPFAVVFWIFCSAVGYLINGSNGAVFALAASIAFSAFMSLFF